MLIKVGLASCVADPNDGISRLEGYVVGVDYKFEIVEDELGDMYRVYPGTGSDLAANKGSLTYYDLIMPDTFEEFFKTTRIHDPRNPDVCVITKPRWA